MKNLVTLITMFIVIAISACGQENRNESFDEPHTESGAQLAAVDCSSTKISGTTSPSGFSWSLNERTNTLEIIGGSQEPGMLLAWALALQLSKSSPGEYWRLTDGTEFAGTLYCTGNSPAECLRGGSGFEFVVNQLHESGRCGSRS